MAARHPRARARRPGHPYLFKPAQWETHRAEFCRLVGKQLSPRIRDLGKITLYRMGAKADYEEKFPTAGPLLTKKANLDLVAAHWDDLLRLAGSLKYGHATASLIVGSRRGA